MKTILAPRQTSLFAKAARTAMVGGLCLLAVASAVVPGIVVAEEKEPETARPTAETAPRKVRVIGADGSSGSVVAPVLSDVERYCTNIADPAKDARAAIQAERLKQLETEIGTKLDELEAKRRETQDWLAQRQAFIDSTSTIVLDIYAGMRPDAAALQLAGLDRTTAASIVAKLKSRTASAILAEMPTGVAAEVTNLIVQKTNKTMDVATAAPGEG